MTDEEVRAFNMEGSLPLSAAAWFRKKGWNTQVDYGWKLRIWWPSTAPFARPQYHNSVAPETKHLLSLPQEDIPLKLAGDALTGYERAVLEWRLECQLVNR